MIGLSASVGKLKVLYQKLSQKYQNIGTVSHDEGESIEQSLQMAMTGKSGHHFHTHD